MKASASTTSTCMYIHKIICPLVTLWRLACDAPELEIVAALFQAFSDTAESRYICT